MINGIDVSDHQKKIDWVAVKGDANCQFVIAQATEGLTITNDTFKRNHDGCEAQGIPFGAYHFFYAKDDGKAQAEFFLNFIDGLEGKLLPMVDVEHDSLAGFHGTPADLIKRLKAFDTAVRASLPAGKLPLIYFGLDFWKTYLGGYDGFSGHPAWPAANNSDLTLDMSGTGWSTWTIWQWTSSGRIAGIGPNVDRDRCRKPLADISR
jgi:lysozyme